ncbi:uncharacterized protein LOC107403371 [Ziziphus jujuba]|uniref:Uncharacterized protein LOC107403371 n=2 Tax=Ziziphus jujuba TaxID=326968 RepID=A0A6P3YUC7_ZIZJJ|nr:uncharacterized protein LOC107403371 [Ziziphus jujuba]KAH7517808.1 hypothetical protein FEM48_Zijuj09G0103500 [Ziziphus jujuba var. spinosa]
MVNIITIYKPLLHGFMKLAAGVRPQTVEIEPGTVMNFWVPTEKAKLQNKPKQAVVFLHGFAMDGIMTWQFQVPALASKYKVYVADLIFFGGSITDKADRTADFQARCVAKGLMKLGIEKCTLVGLSYGGIVGFKMAELYPSLVDSMVVTCSPIALTQSISSESLKRIGFSRWPDYLLPDTVKGVRNLFDIATYKLPYVPNWIYKDILEVMFDNRKEKEELLDALVINDVDFMIPHYPQRISLLWGENDNIFDMETALNLKKQIGDKATLECIEKAGHIAEVERPIVYNRKLKQILASLIQED